VFRLSRFFAPSQVDTVLDTSVLLRAISKEVWLFLSFPGGSIGDVAGVSVGWLGGKYDPCNSIANAFADCRVVHERCSNEELLLPGRIPRAFNRCRRY
jgi:hypothetical protein